MCMMEVEDGNSDFLRDLMEEKRLFGVVFEIWF